jgi:hypothetical protein
MKKGILFIVIAWCAHWAFAVDASEPFASRLFEKDEYRWALVEYERLLFSYPDSSAAGRWHFYTGLCALRDNRFVPALEGFRRAFADSATADSARLYAAECALRLWEPDSAQRFLSGCKLPLGKVYTGYINFCANDFPAARAQLRFVNDSSVAAFKARSLDKLVAEAASFSPKHYAPAALLSIVPGLGHVFCKKRAWSERRGAARIPRLRRQRLIVSG